ncbi:MAG: hypothetical protein K5872_08800 [Rhizobiaceae bacterium]|nr:hypothetical protein [Rhizobiaceae bacterium]MCV0406313.1 hypothetical protein [Rhizobiaceae bacterium]
MPFSGIANPAELTALERAFDLYCARLSISKDGPEGREAAAEIMSLYTSGMVDPAQMLAAMIEGPHTATPKTSTDGHGGSAQA